MTGFIVVAALMVTGVLAALLPPLLRKRVPAVTLPAGPSINARILRDQLAENDADLKNGSISSEQWTQLRDEVQRRVLEEESADAPATASRSPFAAAVLATTVPLLAVALYVWLGTPAALLPPQSPPDAAQSAAPHPIDTMVTGLAARLEANPGDTEGWIMLGRSYAALGRFREAAAAYGRASDQRPRDADLLADYADILGMANGRRMAGEAAAVVKRALMADPDNVKALALAGTAAFEERDFRGAIRHWQRAVSGISEDSEFKQSLKSGIEEANGLLGNKLATQGSAPVSQASLRDRPGASSGVLQGTVRLAAGVSNRAKPDDTVYVFARALQGPRMPLAVQRIKVRDLPAAFSLDDSMAMTPELKLSKFPRVVLVARISASGLAVPQKGDLEFTSAPMPSDSRGVILEIAAARE